jgi:hypothetical protein
MAVVAIGCTDGPMSARLEEGQRHGIVYSLPGLTSDFSGWCKDKYGYWHEDASFCGAGTPTAPTPPSGPTSGDPGTGSGGGGGSPPPPDSAATPCVVTGGAVQDSPDVQAGFKVLWTASNPDAGLVQRSERGGWIVRTSTGFRVEAWTGVSLGYCGMEGEVPYPAEGPGAIVGYVHTHPYMLEEDVLNCENQVVTYHGTPSDPERANSYNLGRDLGWPGPLPGYILDKNGIRTFQGWNTALDGSAPRCGY